MDIFECDICFHEFNDPRVIACGHTFCKSCLQKLKPNELFCPLCRQSFESVDLLPSNFVVSKWMDENKNRSTKKDVKCDNCEKEDKIAVVWCEKCEIYCCEACNLHIHSGKGTRNHSRLTLREKSKKPMFTKCTRHMEEKKFFCLDCKHLMCSVCKEDDHFQHSTMSIFKYGETLKNDLKQSISSFDGKIRYLGEAEIGIRQEIKEKENERDVLREKLSKVEGDLKGKIREEEKIIQQRKNAETSLVVLIKSIEGIGVTDLMNNRFFDLMKERIKKIDEELFPVEFVERMEKERLEKERLEKERLEKERLEKERLEKERSKFIKTDIVCLEDNDTLCRCIKSSGSSFTERAIIINDELKSNDRKDMLFSLTFIKLNCWIAVGLVEKALLKANRSYTEVGHGFYLLSSNRYSWHSKDAAQNNKQAGFAYSSNETVKVSFNSSTNTLHFVNLSNSSSFTITNIPTVDLSPVVLLYGVEDSAPQNHEEAKKQ